MRILLHITRFGTGGSYHPLNTTQWGQPVITVMSEDLAVKRGVTRTIAKTLVHESIHLVIEAPVVNAPKLGHEEKEALVDAVCSCDELKALVDQPYPRQKDYIPALPSNWQALLPWNAG